MLFFLLVLNTYSTCSQYTIYVQVRKQITKQSENIQHKTDTQANDMNITQTVLSLLFKCFLIASRVAHQLCCRSLLQMLWSTRWWTPGSPLSHSVPSPPCLSAGWSETHKHQSQTQKTEFNRTIWNTQTPITNTENRVQQDDLKHTNSNHKHRKQTNTNHKHRKQTTGWSETTPITNTENRVQQDDLKHTNTNHKHRKQSSTGWSETHKHQSQTQKTEFNRMIWNTQTPITNTENRVQQDDLKHTNTNHKHRKQSSTGWSETHKHQSQTQKTEFNRMIWNTQTPITNSENRVQQDDLKHTNTNHKHRKQTNTNHKHRK